MFDSLRRQSAEQRTASARLKQLAATRQPQEEWIDETPSEPQKPVRPRLLGRRVPVVATAVVVVAAITVVGLLAARPEKEMPPPLPAAAVAATTSAGASGSIVVSVVGKVARPGLVTLPEGARVADAVKAAGGASDVDMLALNVARRLADGEQVYVGIPPQADAGPMAAKPAKLNLNTATLAQLDDLPGVGAVTAQRILDYRAERGHFTALEQLRQIDGIGETRYSKLKDLVTIR
ncbi:competence protein ComEA [Kibdelosporangium banguiense]|uniref:Competence protein ComEA n=1 Tax=Kibdelosporangium banguiense TaxID=1365924 RepID=A0ABS4T5J5_9PSEU|nr:ComEA family DNA-binding protein [Kibdelosporangium banguiense]MBP2319741.1 competence protein ComEA [Kibdelosporangium banguiense]